ncbi:OmpP1/FadL family transporter [Aestuariicoccus sp. MJ-SS9]|uniref:OmpP1/FadL family transporter n=1 Tax=Aestuariicoccus sp. MJ-SS9 TaxID=3079855 RepID=UPI0029105607|nr:outer membrane protein transport protein [Aestuariicoccus sp. MJ-SS9]MDU8911544.1 outer membrane protein transport protein [Aestuariicoccus sp. MJ-SS9]
MKHTLTSVAALCLTASAVQAGGIDRSGQSIGVIYKPGSYAELSFGSVMPEVSGTQLVNIGLSSAGADSGETITPYQQFSGALKHDYSDRFSVALIFDQPFGAGIEYDAGTGYFAGGASAEFESSALTSVARYKFNDAFSVHGGLRYQRISAEAFIPYITLPAGPLAGTPYDVVGEKDDGWGYLVGAAYERPDIALRVALTYNSKISHSLDINESSALGLGVSSSTDIDTPESVNLEFQTGIAADTLLFGSVRWVNWSEFDISPAEYKTLTGLLAGDAGSALVEYESDRISYSLGVGRRFNENWAGSVTVGYEPQNGDFASNLGPVDGYWSLGVGASYTKDNIEISGGVRYVWVGDAETDVGPFAPAASFEDNSAIGVGFKIGVTF